MTEQKQWCEGIIIYFDALQIAPRHFREARHPQQRGLLFSVVSKIVITRREA